MGGKEIETHHRQRHGVLMCVVLNFFFLVKWFQHEGFVPEQVQNSVVSQ